MNPADTRPSAAPIPPPVYPFGDQLPPPGETLLVGPGVHWLRMPLPFALDHINLWLLEDGDGWAIVDTGIGNEATRALWEKLFAGTLGGRPVTRIIVTHYHPDHAGNAGWLAERTGAPVFMTTGEFLTAHAVRDNAAGLDHANTLAHYRANGLILAEDATGGVLGSSYRRGVPELPTRYRRLMDGDVLRIGGHGWRVICVYGHAPEQATLFCESLGLFISGDQVLPRITTNVGVWGNQPDANPLRRYLDSLDVLASLPAGIRVLPSHDRVFEGLHDRIANLHRHHEDRLAKLLAACDEPRTAHDILGVLFRRQLDDHQMRFAMAEAVAHLHLLHAEGRVERIEEQGVRRYRRSATTPHPQP